MNQPRYYAPKFHKDGTISYWVESYGWFHRIHPLNIPPKTRGAWEKKDRESWLGQMKLLGYENIAGSWIKTRKD